MNTEPEPIKSELNMMIHTEYHLLQKLQIKNKLIMVSCLATAKSHFS